MGISDFESLSDRQMVAIIATIMNNYESVTYRKYSGIKVSREAHATLLLIDAIRSIALSMSKRVLKTEDMISRTVVEEEETILDTEFLDEFVAQLDEIEEEEFERLQRERFLNNFANKDI